MTLLVTKWIRAMLFETEIDIGEKLRVRKVIRSQKTGMIVPMEGTLVCVTENLGRRLVLVAFADGNSEYLFADEIEYDPRWN